MKTIIGEVVPPDPPPLRYTDERERQKALTVIEDLIQRTESATSRALYERQRERILQAGVADRDSSAGHSLGPFPSQ